jgi:hypothetical protein
MNKEPNSRDLVDHLVRPQRWTSATVLPSENGGFVAYGDYLELERATHEALTARDYSMKHINIGDSMKKPEHNIITIEAARTGWIIKEMGRPAEVFIRWDALVEYIATRLTSEGDKEGINPASPPVHRP